MSRMSTVDLSAARWRKSSYSGGAGDDDACVEVAFVGPVVAVRDSKNPQQPPIVLSQAAWEGLLAAARRS